MSATGVALAAALLGKAGGCCEARTHSAPWFSATFRGERHKIVLKLNDRATADRLLRGLEDYEFALPGTVVADIVTCRFCEDAFRFCEDTFRVSVEVLTVDEEN